MAELLFAFACALLLKPFLFPNLLWQSADPDLPPEQKGIDRWINWVGTALFFAALLGMILGPRPIKAISSPEVNFHPKEYGRKQAW